MVIFKDDVDTFCKYVVHRPPNVDHTVHERIEDQHLEHDVRGLYYIARYEHRPDGAETITVGLDQFCGRINLEDDHTTDAVAARRIDIVERSVREAAEAAGATIHKEPTRYTGEIVVLP
jgi:hypothetical protein